MLTLIGFRFSIISDKFDPSCTFETGDWCGYEELSAQSYLWSRLSGGKSYTGKPIKDHTFGNKTGKTLRSESELDIVTPNSFRMTIGIR